MNVRQNSLLPLASLMHLISDCISYRTLYIADTVPRRVKTQHSEENDRTYYSTCELFEAVTLGYNRQYINWTFNKRPDWLIKTSVFLTSETRETFHCLFVKQLETMLLHWGLFLYSVKLLFKVQGNDQFQKIPSGMGFVLDDLFQMRA